MRLVYLPEAREDVLDVVTYYSQLDDKGLASKFYYQLKLAENEILENPELWRPMGDGYRRKLLNRFRYGIIYHPVDVDILEVVAVIHQSREPDTWKKRI